MIDKDDLVLVLGSTGRVGKIFCELLHKNGYKHYGINRANKWTLNNIYENISPEYIVNLQAVTTTIKLNEVLPYDISAQTLGINLSLFNSLTHGRNKDYRPKGVINIVSSCSYAEDSLLEEDDYLEGNIHPSVRPHGETKKIAYLLGRFAREQYRVPVTTVCFNNIYGGCRDWQAEGLKVLEALVKKFVDAKISRSEEVVIWGSGDAKREFIHANDAAEGLILALQYGEPVDLINIGCGVDVSIKNLAYMISRLTNYNGEIVFDQTKPDGQMQKLLCVAKMKSLLQWSPQISLVEGIKMSIVDYYRSME